MELQEAIIEHDGGRLTTEQFTEIVKENQKAGIFWIPKGKNESRFGFIHHHVDTLKGRFFQNILKKHILREIDKVHSTGFTKSDINHLRLAVTTIHFSWRRGYDKDAFVYSDPRLNALDKYLKEYISSNVDDVYPHDHDFLFKLIDISLGLAKEDAYYRARLVDFAAKFRKAYPDKNISCDLPTMEKFIREYIELYFHNSYPYKHDFMNKLVDIVIMSAKDTTLLTDFVDDYRKTFPDMLIAPAERDNINRWH
jgi:hypothetical protein